MSAEHHRFGAYKENHAPEDIKVQSVEVAQRAYDKHMEHRPSALLPGATAAQHAARKRWADKKFELLMQLEMAKNDLHIHWRKL